jgi:multidrug transporter EmrE-like cation transporter
MDAALSGFMGATTAVLSKIVLSTGSTSSPLHAWISSHCDPIDTSVCSNVNLLARATAVLIIVLLNVAVVKKHIDGMKAQGSGTATAVTTGVNFIATAAYSIALFQDEVNYLWLGGFTCVLVGVAVLSQVTSEPVTSDGTRTSRTSSKRGGRGQDGSPLSIETEAGTGTGRGTGRDTVTDTDTDTDGRYRTDTERSSASAAASGGNSTSESRDRSSTKIREAASSFEAFEKEQRELASKQLHRRQIRQAKRMQDGGYSPTTIMRSKNREKKIDSIEQVLSNAD